MTGCYGINTQIVETVVVECSKFDVSIAEDVGIGGVASLVAVKEVAV